MLPPASLPVPATWREVLEELWPAFRRRSTHALFMALACGMNSTRQPQPTSSSVSSTW